MSLGRPVVTRSSVWVDEASAAIAAQTGETAMTMNTGSMQAQLSRLRNLVDEALQADPNDSSASERIRNDADMALASANQAFDVNRNPGTSTPDWHQQAGDQAQGGQGGQAQSGVEATVTNEGDQGDTGSGKSSRSKQ